MPNNSEPSKRFGFVFVFVFYVQWEVVKDFKQSSDGIRSVFLKEWMEKDKKWESCGNGNGRRG